MSSERGITARTSILEQHRHHVRQRKAIPSRPGSFACRNQHHASLSATAETQNNILFFFFSLATLFDELVVREILVEDLNPNGLGLSVRKGVRFWQTAHLQSSSFSPPGDGFLSSFFYRKLASATGHVWAILHPPSRKPFSTPGNRDLHSFFFHFSHFSVFFLGAGVEVPRGA